MSQRTWQVWWLLDEELFIQSECNQTTHVGEEEKDIFVQIAMQLLYLSQRA